MLAGIYEECGTPFYLGMSKKLLVFIPNFLNETRHKYVETASNILHSRNIYEKVCHICKTVENSNYPQFDDGLWKASVDNSEKLWEKAIFPDNSRKIAVDNVVENWEKLWRRCGKTGEEQCVTL